MNQPTRPGVEHRTVTWQLSSGIVWRPGPNRRNEFRQDRAAMWKCTCGKTGAGATRDEVRRRARLHRAGDLA